MTRDELLARKEKLTAWLRAREGKDGFRLNVEAIKKELAQIEAELTPVDG